MSQLPILETPRLRLFIPGPDDAERCISYLQENETHLRPWGPPILPSHFDLEHRRKQRAKAVEAALAGTRFGFALVLQDAGKDAPFLGFVNLTEIVRGVFQACFLGYDLAEKAQGHGYMTEACGAVIDFAFGALALHRLMANYSPTNARSAAVLRRLGFTIEGIAKDYLFINGAWRDHVLTSLTNPNPEAPEI